MKNFLRIATPLCALLAGCYCPPESPEMLTPQPDVIPSDDAPATEKVKVDGEGCSFTMGGWGQACSGGNVGCLRDTWFDEVYPEGLTVGVHSPLSLPTSKDVEDLLPLGGPAKDCPYNTFNGQLTALRLNVDFSNAGVFGKDDRLAEARVTSGKYAGLTAADLIVLAETLDPCEKHGPMIDAMTAINEGFGHCDPGELPPDEDEDEEPDGDDDGVPESADCDDTDANVGALLYAADFSSDDGALVTTATLTDPWTFESTWVTTAGGGQQALLGTTVWAKDTVTWASVKADGATTGRGGATERFRAGLLARAATSDEADEGFTGYRCAVVRNVEGDCAAPGPFVQLAAFLPGPEDDLFSECEDTCVNPTFDELKRVPRSEKTRVLEGDTAALEFWAVGDDLVCAFTGIDGEHVVAAAQDTTLTEGTTGLSVLNAAASFSSLKVCEALGLPE